MEFVTVDPESKEKPKPKPKPEVIEEPKPKPEVIEELETEQPTGGPVVTETEQPTVRPEVTEELETEEGKNEFIEKLCKKWKPYTITGAKEYNEKMHEIGAMTEGEFKKTDQAPRVEFMQFTRIDDNNIRRKIKKAKILFIPVTTSPPDQDLNINGIPTKEELPLMTPTQKNRHFNPTIPRPDCTVRVIYEDNKLIEKISVPEVRFDNRTGNKLPIHLKAYTYTTTYSFEEDKLIEKTSIIDTEGKDLVTMKKTYLLERSKGGNIKRIRPTKKRKLIKTRKSKKEKKQIKRRRPTKRRPTKRR